MKSKYEVSIGLLVLALGGCVSPKAYVDPKYAGTSYSEIKRVEKQYNANIDVEFQRNGSHYSAADSELRANVERIFRASGVVVPSPGSSDMSIKVVCNNIADISGAAMKGFGTGLTFGAAGTAVTDFYQITIELKRGDEVVSKTYDHDIHTTVGNKAAPVQGVTPTTLANAFSGVVEDVVLQFVKEMQDSNVLTLNELFMRNSA